MGGDEDDARVEDGPEPDEVDEEEEEEDEEEDQQQRKVVLVETKGARGAQGILSAAEFSRSMRLDFDDLSPEDENYEAKLTARQIVTLGYPLRTRATLGDLVDSVLNQPETVWARGSWVEYLGNDMTWRLAMIRRVVRQAPDSFDWSDPRNAHVEPEWNYFYNVGQATLISGLYIRASEEGLRTVFGGRPWVWQQYALLRLEKYLRFQVDHERDYAEVDTQKFAEDLFDEWLEDSRNADFKEVYDSYSETVQVTLRDHLLAPFELIDSIVEDKEDWEFDDEDVSVFTYLSVLGSGGFFAVCCMAIQLIIPAVLLMNALDKSARFDASFTSHEVFVRTEWETFCTGHGDPLGKTMNLAVLFIYLITIIPESFTRFYRTAGDSATAYSRLNSLREVVWHQNDDSFFQKIGFKMDRYMNTAYVSFLYGVVLFILFNTDEVLDIILNALAADFIHRIDESIARQEWFDPDQRYLRAGAVQLMIQSTLRLRIMDSPRYFCKFYGIDPEEFARATTGNPKSALPPIKNFVRAHQDDNDPKYKSVEDEQFFLCAEYAHATGNAAAFRQFKKRLTNFSFLDKVFNLFRFEKYGMFHQYEAYRTWSVWDRILFIAHVPTREEVEASFLSGTAKTFTQTRSGALAFIKDVLSVLSGYMMLRDIGNALNKGFYGRVPFHFFDSILQILAYMIQLSFPIIVTAGIWLIPFCY